MKNLKKCKDCGRLLPIDKFPIRLQYKDGHAKYCIDCQNRCRMLTKTKECLICHKVLPVEEFTRNDVNKDGRTSYCKKCKNENDKKRYSETAYGNVQQILGGFKIYILNHYKDSEFKYNILNVTTGKVISTNNKDKFLETLEKVV